jgi:hypothetical protein
MQDPERRPLPRPARRKENADMSNKDFKEDEEYNMYADDDGDLSSAYTLPRNRLSIALIIGIVAGIVMALIYFLVPFLNAQAFQQAAELGVKMSYNTAVTVTELRCVGIFLAVVICASVGYFTGKYAVQRRLGFLAGLIAGAIFSLGQTISGYIPNYPGSSATPPFSAAYILPFLLITLILGCLGGLISLLVTWMTTRRHPYYTGA